MELSYSPKFQLLKCILSQEICLQRSLKFGIGNHHFETNALRPGRARPLSGTSSCSRDFVLASVFVYWRPWLIFNLNHFEPERVPNPEDGESKIEEVNNWLEGTFWWSCEWCQIMPTQREGICCWEQPEEECKIEGRILSLYSTASVAVNGKTIFFVN